MEKNVETTVQGLGSLNYVRIIHTRTVQGRIGFYVSEQWQGLRWELPKRDGS